MRVRGAELRRAGMDPPPVSTIHQATCPHRLVAAFEGTVIRELAKTDQGRGFSVSPEGGSIVYTL